MGENPQWAVPCKRTKFHLVLIKPTHYDDDGYPITWLRSHIPSNTLAALYGLGEDCRRRERLGARRRHPDQAVRRDQYAGAPRPHRGRHQAQRRQGADLPGRRAVQPVPARRRSRPPVPQGRPAGGDGRLPCRRLPVDAAGRAARDPGGHGHGHLDLRRRGRGRPARQRPARCLERHAEAALQLHGRSAGHRGRADAAACRRRRWPATRAASRASISAAAARSSARSAPSSTCRAARAASAMPTISKRSSARTTSRASRRSSSPTTTWPATSTGRTSSTG